MGKGKSGGAVFGEIAAAGSSAWGSDERRGGLGIVSAAHSPRRFEGVGRWAGDPRRMAATVAFTDRKRYAYARWSLFSASPGLSARFYAGGVWGSVIAGVAATRTVPQIHGGAKIKANAVDLLRGTRFVFGSHQDMPILRSHSTPHGQILASRQEPPWWRMGWLLQGLC